MWLVKNKTKELRQTPVVYSSEETNEDVVDT